jgi:peptide/nickel transport system permease protein
MMKKKKELDLKESYFLASQWKLMWRKFIKHRLAILGFCSLSVFYLFALFSEFFAVEDPFKRHQEYIYAPPQKLHFFDENGKFHLRPFVYGLKRELDMKSLRRIYTEDKSKKYPLYLFVRGDPYKMWGFIRSDIHFVGIKGDGVLFLFGSEQLGRDMFSRIMYGTRISVSIGLLGVSITFVLGCIIGGISGFFGGAVDMTIQRIIEFLMSVPTIPLWMALTASLPRDWPSVTIYFMITIILSIFGWCSLARVVRSKLISTREEDFVMAATIAGASSRSVILRHLLPSFLSYLIVRITLSIPGMILGETALSFLGLGLRPPIVSWGVLLKQAQDVTVIALQPWLLIPALFVIVFVISFNFLGDGLRDAADPYR